MEQLWYFILRNGVDVVFLIKTERYQNRRNWQIEPLNFSNLQKRATQFLICFFLKSGQLINLEKNWTISNHFYKQPDFNQLRDFKNGQIKTLRQK